MSALLSGTALCPGSGVSCLLEIFHPLPSYHPGKDQSKEGHMLIIYYKVVSEKSVSDPEHLIHAFGIKLIKMNIKSQKVLICNGILLSHKKE